PLMQSAKDDFAAFLEKEKIEFKIPNAPIILNGTAKPSTDPDEIKRSIIDALTTGVKFRESILGLLEKGMKNFLEIGTGPLSEMVEKISSDTKQLQVDFG
ncbi:MAG: [acyl-carrier-protein] S-malonyltransferase, partial [Patescibacteria group bacterium]